MRSSVAPRFSLSLSPPSLASLLACSLAIVLSSSCALCCRSFGANRTTFALSEAAFSTPVQRAGHAHVDAVVVVSASARERAVVVKMDNALIGPPVDYRDVGPLSTRKTYPHLNHFVINTVRGIAGL